MAIYLGGTEVGIAVNAGILNRPNVASGTVTSDSGGVITFPKLSFTPKVITVWNVVQRDLKQEAVEDGEEWDESYVRYIHDGVILTAINQNGTWVSQVTYSSSGEVAISNTSFEYGSAITKNSNGVYEYALHRSVADNPEDSNYDITDTAFNYVIYG